MEAGGQGNFFASNLPDQEAVVWFHNRILHCIAFGEAAGTASAIALQSGVGIKNVDMKAL